MKKTKLSDFCDLKNGYAFKSKDYVPDSNTLVCRMSNIRPDGTFNIEYNKKCVPDEFCEIYKEYLLEDGDLIVAMTDMANDPKILGVPTIVDTNGYNVLLNQRVGKLIIKKQDLIDKRYLKYALSVPSLKSYYKKFAGGGLQINIGKKEILNIEIPIPSLTVQRKIVSTLQKTQEIIDKRKAQIEALDQLTQSVFLEMFGDPVTNPNGWEIVNLQDIADYFIGLTYKPNDVSDEGIVVLRSSNIQNGVIDLNDIVRVKKEVNDKLLVKQNDILMCSRNGSARLVGKVALIPELEERMTFGAFMTIIRSRYYCYLYNYFQSSAFRRQITSGATTTINQITKKMLNYVKLPLPPTSLQNEFAHKVEQIQHQKEILQTSLLELENMYNSLMQKAFKGELFTEEKVSNL